MHLYCEFSLSEQGEINTAQWSQHIRSKWGITLKTKRQLDAASPVCSSLQYSSVWAY